MFLLQRATSFLPSNDFQQLSWQNPEEASEARVVNLTDGRSSQAVNRNPPQTGSNNNGLVLSLRDGATPAQNIAKKSQNKSLDLQLQQAALGSDQTLCRYLIEMRANVNTKNEAGQTPLQIALTKGNLLICKVLIDRDAEVTDRDKDQIREVFRTRDLRTSMDTFLVKRPNPHVPQVRVPSSVSSKPVIPLVSMSEQERQRIFTKPIFLQLIADEALTRNYGVVLSEFHNTEPFSLARHFTVIRVLVDNKDRLVSTIDNVKELLHGLPLLHVIFNAHGNNQVLSNGISPFLKIEDRSLMRKIAKRVDPFGTITLDGCLTANRHYNIAKVFSQQAFGRIVYGSPVQSKSRDFSIFTNLGQGIPPLYMPYFIPPRSAEISHLDSYHTGEIELTGRVDDEYAKFKVNDIGYVYIHHNGHKISSCNNIHEKCAVLDRDINLCLSKITAIQKAKLSTPQSWPSDSEDSTDEHAAARRADLFRDLDEDAAGTLDPNVNFS